MDKKIVLVTLAPHSHRTSEENLGLEYLKSALTNEGYRVEIIDAWLNNLSLEEVYNKIISEQNDLLFVGISSYMGNTCPTIELIKKLKYVNSNIKILCGGFGPTFYPKDYLENGSDYVLRGEGEKSICQFANSLINNGDMSNVKGLGYKNNGNIILNDMHCLIENLDEIPFPSRDNMEVVLNKKSTVNMLTSRGCSGNCEFCSVISFFRLSDGKVWRTRSIENIVDEIELLYKNGVKFIKVVDDSFVDGIRDEAWCKKFADEMQKRNIKVKLRGQIRADKVTDSILADLKRAGFFSFACGIENGTETALARMNKKATLEDNKRALELFKKHGYIIQMGYILFDKDTTLEELEINYKFLCEYNYAITKGIFSEMFSTEGTRLNETLKNNGDLEETDFLINNNKYNLDNESVRKIYDILKKWHKMHSKLYDMTIDPLTAPKVLSEEYQSKFYEEIMKLKKLDLMFFKDILFLIKNNPSILDEKYIYDYDSKCNEEYNNISINVRKLYKDSGLIYDALANPFL